MVQQHNIQKYSKYDHYCNALYKYAREMAIQFREHLSFLSTDGKNKVKVGEANCLIAALTRGRKVLVTHGQVMQAADHDFSSITVTPTVVLMNYIPEKIGDSWQTWAPHKFFICQNCNHCAL